MASDGLWDAINDQEAVKILTESISDGKNIYEVN